jgi:hypothetical protein
VAGGQTYAFDPGSAAALIARGGARATGTRREATPTAFPGRAVVSLTSPGGAIFGTVSWRLGEQWVTVGDVYVPQRLHVDMPGSDRDTQLSLTIESHGGVPTFTRIEFNSGRVGRPVIGQHLAIARRHLSYRLDTIVELVASAEPPDPFQSPRWADSEAAHSAVRDAKRRRHPTTTGRRRRVITPELLAGVADTYRRNVDGNPTEHVSRAYQVSYSTAARWVSLCRSAEYRLLPPSDGQGKVKA